MLLRLPPMEGHGIEPRLKNGPALAAHGAEAVRDAIAEAILKLPERLRRSLTWDQEMAQHAQLRLDTGLAIYFCDPKSMAARHQREHLAGVLVTRIGHKIGGLRTLRRSVHVGPALDPPPEDVATKRAANPVTSRMFMR
jgi:hypothetical protein